MEDNTQSASNASEDNRANLPMFNTRARPLSTLRPNRTGIKRIQSELEFDSSYASLQELLERAAEVAAEKAIRKIFGEGFVEFGVSAIQELIDEKVVRDVVDAWCGDKGKQRLKDLSITLKVQNVVSHVKQLLLLDSPHKERRITDFCHQFDGVSTSIVSRSPSGQGFVDLFASYVDANLFVKKMPTEVQLILIESQLEKGATFGLGKQSSEWLLYMTRELRKAIDVSATC